MQRIIGEPTQAQKDWFACKFSLTFLSCPSKKYGMDRKTISAKIFGVLFLLSIAGFGVLYFEKTQGISPEVFDSKNIDSIHIRQVHANRTYTLIDRDKINQICKSLATIKKYNANRKNINHDFIILKFFLKNNNAEELHILDNVYHGQIIASGWSIYKSDSTVQTIMNLLK
jgi:hypothetical protein